MLELRPAKPEDARLLKEFAERTFRETFSSENTPEDMALYVGETYSEEQQAAEIADPNKRTLLAFDNAQEDGHVALIGFYQLIAHCPDPAIPDPDPVKLDRLYVDSRWHGKKIAHRLLQEAIDRSKQEGFSTFWMGVWERNFRALAFYKKWGFIEAGSLVFQLGTDAQRDLIFYRKI